jgi:hypothetical protein
VKALLGILVIASEERIIDVGGPAFFLKGGQDRFLVLGRLTEALDDLAGVAEFAVGRVPAG